jgi:hypothetical protein
LAIVAVLLLFGPDPVRAQHAPAQKPSTQDYLRQIDQQMKDAERLDPSTGRVFRVFRWWVFLAVGATIIVAALVVLKVVSEFYLRASGPTDPEKLALTDPWVRAQRARERAAGGGGSNDAPPPVRNP